MKQNIVNIGFVIDATGSMQPWIDLARDKVYKIIDLILDYSKRSEIKMAVVIYRDRCDLKVIDKQDFTENLDAIHEYLDSVTAMGGGDEPEDVNQGLEVALEKLSWDPSPNCSKIIFLVGDAPPHMDYDQKQYPELCDVAATKGVLINTLLCGRSVSTENFWQDIALKGHGEFAKLPTNSKIENIQSPYDKDIAELNQKLNATLIPYGDRQTRETISLTAAKTGTFSSDKVTARLSVLAKTGKSTGGTEELIDLVESGKLNLSYLKDEFLPDHMKDLSKEQILELIKQKSEERKAIKSKIKDLLALRLEYIQDEMKRQEGQHIDSFDKAIMEIIKKQVPES